MEKARDDWHEYWYPPTASQLLRRARSRLVTEVCFSFTSVLTRFSIRQRYSPFHPHRQGNQLERRLKAVELEEKNAMRRLTARACSSDESEIRSIAREVSMKRSMAAKLRDARKTTAAAESRITMVESSTAVRAAMRTASQASRGWTVYPSSGPPQMMFRSYVLLIICPQRRRSQSRSKAGLPYGTRRLRICCETYTLRR